MNIGKKGSDEKKRMEILPTEGDYVTDWAMVILSCICLPVGTLINIAASVAILLDYSKMERFKSVLIFLLSLIFLNQCCLVHLAVQVLRIFWEKWILGQIFCIVNYGFLPLQQSSTFILTVLLLGALSQSSCQGLQKPSNSTALLMLAFMCGLLNCLFTMADYLYSTESRTDCFPDFSRREPLWECLAVALEFILFYLGGLVVVLGLFCGEIRGNPKLQYGSLSAGSLIVVQWLIWLPKYLLILFVYLVKYQPKYGLGLGVDNLVQIRLYSFLYYLIVIGVIYPVICLLFYIVLGHIVLNINQLSSTTNSKYYDSSVHFYPHIYVSPY